MLIKFFSLNNLLLSLVVLFILITLIHSEDLFIEIDNPKFSEKGLNDKAYEIKANKGFKSGENLRLETIEGKFRSNDGTWIYLKADNGNFSQTSNKITLNRNINFYTDRNESFLSDYAKYDIDKNFIELEENVKHTSDLGIITSNRSVIREFSQILYTGNVETKIYLRD